MSPLLNSDLQAGQLIASKTSKKHWTGVGTFNTTQAGTQNYPLMRALRNMKSIEIQVCPNDTNAVDNGVVGYPDDPRVQTSGSLYLH